MKKIITGLCVLMICINAVAQVPSKTVARPASVKGVFKNLLDSFSYAAGYNIANNMKAQKISKLNIAMMMKAIDDVYKGKQPLLSNEQINYCIQKQIDLFNTTNAKAEIARGVAFLSDNKKRKEVITLPSGLQYEILKKADSSTIKPTITDSVVVNYIGTLIDGKEFDNSYRRGAPATFLVTQVIRGWVEILQLMSVGDKWKIYVPTELGYNLNPRDPNLIPPGAALIFEITLEDIKPSTPK